MARAGSADLRYARSVIDDWPTRMTSSGNHDIGDNPLGSGAGGPHPLDLERLRDSRPGPDYWALETDPWLVLGLDAQLFGSAVEQETERWEWLGDFVARAGKRPVAVMLHKPLFQESPQDEAPHVRYVPFEPRQRLLRMMPLWMFGSCSAATPINIAVARVAGIGRVWVPSTAFVFPDEMQERFGAKLVGFGVSSSRRLSWFRLGLRGRHAAKGCHRFPGDPSRRGSSLIEQDAERVVDVLESLRQEPGDELVKRRIVRGASRCKLSSVALTGARVARGVRFPWAVAQARRGDESRFRRNPTARD